MKRILITPLALLLALSIPINAISRGGPPFTSPGSLATLGPQPQGFSTLLCLADALLGGASLKNAGDTITLFGGQVVVKAASDVRTVNGVSEIDVQVIHGDSFSDHTIRFIDNGDGALDCGDTIVAVI